jgi:hypothetical protein
MPITIKRGSQNFEAVILLQAMLRELKYSVVINAVFDRSLEQAVEQFQLVNNVVADGIVGPKTWQVLYLRSNDYLSVSTNRFIEEVDLINAAKELQIEVAAIKAVNEVESRGMGFVNDFPVILFERHVFWKRLKAHGEDPSLLLTSENKDILNRTPGGYKSSAREIRRLDRAQLIHKQAALESASWGLFQIMGFHWKFLGYENIEDFVERMKTDEVQHLKAFVRFIQKNNLASKLRLRTGEERLSLDNFTRFARAYNGRNYTKNRYHTKMLSSYNRYRQKADVLFTELSTVFMNAMWNQDRIQNEILRRLLGSFYSAKNVSEKAPEHSLAFDAVRDNKVNHPLYRIRQNTDLIHVDANHTDFFVRDFMQVHSKGGPSQNDPMVIGKQSTNPDDRDGFDISDGILNSNFAQHFDWMTKGVNKNLAKQNIPQEARYLSDMAHRDAIQLIPFSRTVSHFAGATMQYVNVMGNRIFSKGRLQGIFATDGAFKDLHICNNSIDIGGSHYISINGMLSGRIDGNTDMNQEVLTEEHLTLWPLRIGGGANIYILGFKNAQHLKANDADYYAYEDIEGSQAITDLRQQPIDKRNASNWVNVDMIALQSRYQNASNQAANVRREGAGFQDVKQIWHNMMLQVGDEF